VRTKRKIIPLIKLISLIAGFCLIFLAIFQQLRSDLFKINQVICFENDHPCPTTLLFKVNSLVLGKNILFLSPQKVEEEILSQLPKIEKVKIEKKLLHQITIHLAKKKAIATVEFESQYYQVDYRGTILASLDQPSDLPLLVVKELSLSPDGGQIETPAILTSLDCLYQLLFGGIDLRRAEVTDSRYLSLSLKAGPTVLISLEGEVKKQVDSLQLILARAKIEGKQVKVIDLRFDKPVITYD
jgi:cell division septal protein FtsQ